MHEGDWQVTFLLSLRTMTRRTYTYRFGPVTYQLGSRTHIMGVLNVTPDSFSDGGKYYEPGAAVDRALQMIEEGADFIDVGGESTRPKGAAYGEGAQPVGVEEELRRVLPVIKALVAQTSVPISIDTYKAAVAAQALEAGACIINDISGFMFDEAMPGVAAQAGASVVLMHIQGTPQTMQTNPHYANVVNEVSLYLKRAAAKAERAGVKQVIVDPGIGFGKTLAHNLSLISHADRLASLGYPVLVGASRKSFVGEILGLPVTDRREGSLAAAVAAVLRGVHILRVHDVRETKRAVMVADALRTADF